MISNRNLAKGSPNTPERVEQRSVVAPRVDVYENKDEVLLVADLPGATKDTINVHLDKGELTIEARRREESAPGVVVVAEHEPRDYHRAFAMPRGIDGAKIDAQFVDGVLRVKLPKSDGLKPRRIDVRAE